MRPWYYVQNRRSFLLLVHLEKHVNDTDPHPHSKYNYMTIERCNNTRNVII